MSKKNESETTDFDAVLAATYVVAESLKAYATTPSSLDPVAPIRAETDLVLKACAGNPTREHSDEDYDAVINSGLTLLKQMASALDGGAKLPSEIISSCKILFQACVKADLICLDDL